MCAGLSLAPALVNRRSRVKALAPRHRVWIVVSALSQVTNALLRCIEEVTAPGLAGDTRFASYAWMVEAHRKLGRAMALASADMAPVEAMLDELKRLLDGILLTQVRP